MISRRNINRLQKKPSSVAARWPQSLTGPKVESFCPSTIELIDGKCCPHHCQLMSTATPVHVTKEGRVRSARSQMAEHGVELAFVSRSSIAPGRT